MSSISHVLVLGGTGFVGRAICSAAALKGLKVTSVSRRPPTDAILRQPWAKDVLWAQGDAADPNSIANHIKNTKTVIHSVGLLLESNLNMYASGARSTGANSSYEVENRDSAIVPACLLKDNVGDEKRFLMVSVGTPPPILSQRYISTKRAAEAKLKELADGDPHFSWVVARPSLLLDGSKAVGAFVNRLTKNNTAIRNNICSREDLAEFLIKAAMNPAIKGFFYPSQFDSV